MVDRSLFVGSALPKAGCHVYACVDMFNLMGKTCLRKRKHGTQSFLPLSIWTCVPDTL
jgi:hypothetical protein